jgi:hypothetical protein
MGIMAACAALGFHGIITVGLFKGCIAFIMAPKTQSRFAFQQQVLLRGTVRGMARPASPILQKHLMNYLAFIPPLLVTEITDVVTFRLHELDPLGGMGVMAGRAFPCFQGSMDMRLIQANFRFVVAPEAEIVAGPLEHQLGDDAMAHVALFTFLFLDNFMNAFQGHILVSELLMAVQALLADKFLLGIGLIPAKIEQATDEQDLNNHRHYQSFFPQNAHKVSNLLPIMITMP